jgi:hypothetical protein
VAGNRPNRPSTLPAELPNRPNIGGNRPNRPVTLPAELPNRPGIGGNRPGIGGNLPDLGGNRPGFGGNRPGNRPDWGDKWNNVNNNFGNSWNNWHNENNVNINNFHSNRDSRWNSVNNRWKDNDWHNRFDSDDYWDWRRDVRDFRRDRCHEIWDGCWGHGFHDRFFHHGYWGSCWWAPAAIAGRAAAITSTIVSPWWWWQPTTYGSVSAFYGPSYSVEPVVYDPGTTVIYEGDTIYINGQSAGSATEYRERTIELASPPLESYPVPQPPTKEGEPAQWLPMGVWALTQQEQGDAVMFFQLSVDKNGLVAGAYKNVMTNEDQPIVGQLDKETQRVAWHVGDNTETVYETGLSSLTYDVASVFVHFGPEATQTWLLVRLPSPEIPPGAVSLPELKKSAPPPK